MKKKKNIYDVYDSEGRKIISEKTALEIGEILKVPEERVYRSYREGRRLSGLYRILICDKSNHCSAVTELIMSEWDMAIEPFKNVKWVKKYAPGITVLGAKKHANIH